MRNEAKLERQREEGRKRKRKKEIGIKGTTNYGRE